MGIKVKREATKERKNALGRKVVVNRNASGNEAVSKTRTVYSKSGGVISEKKSYKDRGSVAGKLLERKVDKSIAKRDRANEKQESLRRKEIAFKKEAMEGAKIGAAKTSMATKRGIKNAVKMNEARDEFQRNPMKYDNEKVSKAMETGRGRKVQRVMRRELKKGRPF